MQIKTVLVCFPLLDNNSNIFRFWQFYFILNLPCFFSCLRRLLVGFVGRWIKNKVNSKYPICFCIDLIDLPG